jgi:hypothetical protein
MTLTRLVSLLVVVSVCSVVEENSATEVEDGEYEEVITYTRQ